MTSRTMKLSAESLAHCVLFGPCVRAHVGQRTTPAGYRDGLSNNPKGGRVMFSCSVSQVKIALQVSIDYTQRRLYGNPHPA